MTNTEMRNAAALLLILTMAGCMDPTWVTTTTHKVAAWGNEIDDSIPGIDSATLARIEYTFADGGHLLVVLWTDCHMNSGCFTGVGGKSDGNENLDYGNIEWDGDSKATCSYKIRLKKEGPYTVELDGSAYDLKNGTTILFKNRDGKVETKQIAGLPSDQASLMKYAHENQEIVDFYSDDQASESPQNETQRE
ncbi:hypothetical protein Pan258_29370 [Symmachiella dynata]|uniref:hypothetical protein n=1 Tax=Symmachiella dynata TaxID=2527995 RepID=UPI00118BC8F1|nr:hypothetical protein [Symmachiella dynata]QDT48890.1 hypothetical protein Pan258_29370 [Symmachiella dynata]